MSAQNVTLQQAMSVACPACHSKPGKPCTQPTNTGRKPVAWVHLVRESAFMFPPEESDD